MNKNIKKTALPSLRFVEFQDTEGWEAKTLFDLAIDGFSNGVFNDPKKVGSGYRLINVLDMFIETTIDENRLSLVDISEMEFLKNKVEFGDIFFTRSSLVPSGIAQSNIYLSNSKDITFDGHLIRLRPNTSIVVPMFLHYLLKTASTRSQLIVKGKRATMTTIGQSDVASINVLIPKTEKEQQKITACLTSLDDMLTAQSQKVEALKVHKKGLMQQLFPAEGETVPQVRFAEFRDTEGWVETTLGEIANFSSGGTPSKDVAEYWGGEIPWISAASMYDTVIKKSNLNITEKAVKNGAQMAQKGILLILVRGSMLYKRIPMGITAREVAFNQDVKALTLSKEIIDSFVLYQLMAAESRLLNAVTTTGIGAGKLDTSELKQFIMMIPSVAEQEKIAVCLTSLDEMIAEASKKLDTLKAHKKGLMQQLFPNTNEEI